MTNQFISPNWHPLLIHYPLAFLSAGIVIELLSFLWPRGSFRAAGRWMILLGALSSVPALAAGIYSYRIVIGGGAAQPRMVPWFQAIAQSTLSAEQWRFMRYHIWLNCIGVAVVVLAVTIWFAATDAWRRTLYFPTLLALLCGMGLFGVGSWFGGEAVYRLATAVELPPAQVTTPSSVDGVAQNVPAAHLAPTRGLKWVVPPIELHIVLAGVVVALMFGAIAVSIRRLEPRASTIEPPELIGPDAPGETESDTLEVIEPSPAVASVEPGPSTITVIPAARFWLLTSLAAVATGVGGLWSAVGSFTPERLVQNRGEITAAPRFLLHTILGVALILLPLVLAMLTRWGRRQRGITYAFVLLIAMVIGFQFWFGIAMCYDGHKGPLLNFNSPPTSAGH
jgi:uncharacterized membrane protein